MCFFERCPPHRDSGFIIFVPPLNVHSFLFHLPLSSLQLSNASLLPQPSFPFMPATPPGPWALEKVKKRLRLDQEEREEAASARYRRLEDKHKDKEASSVDSSACKCGVVLVLACCCLLLSLAVLILSSVVLRIAK